MDRIKVEDVVLMIECLTEINLKTYLTDVYFTW